MSTQKKIYFPIIAYGGMCRADFGMSCASLFVRTLQEKSNLQIFSTGIFFESLISRARNASAAACLHYDCDYLLFIDADIAFDPSDVFKLLEHNKDVVCGVYPKKYYSASKVKYLANNHKEVFETDKWKSSSVDFATEMDEAFLQKVAQKQKLIEVNYAATGFMLIRKTVFEQIIREKPDIHYKNDVDGYSAFNNNDFYDFFPAQVNRSSKKYESEDYGFCNLWRSLGGKIYVDPTINLHHVGTCSYNGNLTEQSQIYMQSING